MLELPGRLERSTLGDVLGALHRSGATGALRIEESGPDGSRQHVIYLRDGLITEVESGAMPLSAGPLSAGPPSAGPRPLPPRQHCLDQLESLFGLTRARLSFRVMGQRPARTPGPLEPPEFLHGRQRRRDTRAPAEPGASDVSSARQRALSLLGLSGEPSGEAIRSAFRQLARRWHPDRHPDAGELTRAALCRRFAQISEAYQQLLSAAEAAPVARAASSR